MKKFLLSLAALLSVVGVRAGVTDLPELTTDVNNPIYYVIHNTRSTSGKFIYYDATANTIKDNNPNVMEDKYKFYFTGKYPNKIKIHNVAADTKMLKNEASWDGTGADCIIGVTPYEDGTTGCYIQYGSSITADCLNESNSNNGYTHYKANDAGSIFTFEKVEDVKMPEAGKTYVVECPLYIEVQQKMKGLTNTEGNNLGWNTVIPDNESFQWAVNVNDAGKISLKNVATDKYVGGTVASDTETFGTIDYAGSGQFYININAWLHTESHSEGNGSSGNIVSWHQNSTASRWTFVEATVDDCMSEMIDRMPAIITTDDEAPLYFVVKSGRTGAPSNGNSWYTYTSNDKKIALDGYAGTDAQLWQLKPVTFADGNLLLNLLPKNGGGEAMSYDNTNNGAQKITAQPLNTEGWTNTWRLIVTNQASHYRLQTSNEANYLSQNGGGSNKMGLWNDKYTSDEGTQMYIYTPEEMEAYTALPGIVSSAETLVSQDKYGYYKSNEEFATALENAKSVSDASYAKFLSDVQAATTALQAAVEGLEQIVPTPGFYRIKNNPGTAYLVAGTTGRTRFTGEDTDGPDNVFYYDGSSLISFANGLHIGDNANNFLQYTDVVDTKSRIVFECDPSLDGKVFIKFSNSTNTLSGAETPNRYLYSDQSGNSNAGGSVTIDPTYQNYRFTLENVTWLPVPIDATVGYATLYSPVELGLKYGGEEDRVTPYTAEINTENSSVKLIPQTAIPANTGVILRLNNQNGYKYNCIYLPVQETTVADATSALSGSLADKYITPESGSTCYVLSKPDNKDVAFYKAAMNNEDQTAFLNHGFKAYLPVSGSNAREFTFDFGGTETGIESIIPGTEDTNATIYDLSGRRVQNAQKGIYIINGKKVIK